MFTLDTANVVLMSPRVSGECTLQEPWFGANYGVQGLWSLFVATRLVTEWLAHM